MRQLATFGSRALVGAFSGGLVLGLLAPVVASWFRVASRRAAPSDGTQGSAHRLVIDGAWPADPAALASRAGTETNSRASFLASECPTDIFVVHERW
jgi:hypothetical protein